MIDWSKPIETCEGYPAKVISTDFTRGGYRFRVVQIEEAGFGSAVYTFHEDGSARSGPFVLRNRKVKMEAWANLYRRGGRTYVGNTLFKTEGEAREIAAIACTADHIVTLKLEWEE